MKDVIGFLLILCGMAVGLYVGVWLCLVGGIIDIVEQIRADEMCSTDLAIGVVKIICANLVGGISSLVLIYPGMAILKK